MFGIGQSVPSKFRWLLPVLSTYELPEEIGHWCVCIVGTLFGCLVLLGVLTLCSVRMAPWRAELLRYLSFVLLHITDYVTNVLTMVIVCLVNHPRYFYVLLLAHLVIGCFCTCSAFRRLDSGAELDVADCVNSTVRLLKSLSADMRGVAEMVLPPMAAVVQVKGRRTAKRRRRKEEREEKEKMKRRGKDKKVQSIRVLHEAVDASRILYVYASIEILVDCLRCSLVGALLGEHARR
eukprot:Skav236399  [mRNA]  locus=scaffold1702:66549:79704:- [translate_table: standard]